MIRSLRQNASALLLLFLLVGVTSVASYWQLRQESNHPALATFSAQRDGARGLLLWAQALGYETLLETPGVFSPPPEATMALIMEPQIPGISEEEWRPLDAWIKDGGTLLLAGEGFGTALALQHHDFNLQYRQESEDDVVQIADNTFMLARDPLANMQPRAFLESERADYDTLLTIDGHPVVVRLKQGQGQMIFSALPYPLSNRGLKEPGNATFVLSILAQTEEDGAIWFDEWHHGLRTSTSGPPSGLGQWLARSHPGQAILYTAVVLFLWLALSGTRLGPPIVFAKSEQRRAPAEHAAALANLSRRAGHQEAICHHYRHELKRTLGSRYGLSAALPDDEFTHRLASNRPDLDEAHLSALLAALRRPKISESQMLHLAQQVTTWINQ